MSKVGLVGYFGWGNFGDELMLGVWREAFSGLADASPVHTLQRRPYFERSANAVADDVDAVLIGGGDLILPDTVSSLYWNRAWLRRPVVVSGVGVALERSTRADVIPRMRDFLQHSSVRAITLRDRASISWVRSELEPAVPIRGAPDLGFAADLPHPEPARDTVAVVLRKTPSPDDVATVHRIRGLARTQDLGLEHLVLATGRTRDFEIAALREVFGEAAPIATADSVTDLVALTGGYAHLYTAKFHGAVVAARYGVPWHSLRDTNKVQQLREVLGWALADETGRTSPEVASPTIVAARVRDLEQQARAEVAHVVALLQNP